MNHQSYVLWLNGTVELDFGTPELAIDYFQQAIQKEPEEPTRWLNYIGLIEEDSVRVSLYNFLKQTFPKATSQIEVWIDGDMESVDIEEQWLNQYDYLKSQTPLWRLWNAGRAMGMSTLRFVQFIRITARQYHYTWQQARNVDHRLDTAFESPSVPSKGYEFTPTQLLSKMLISSLSMLNVNSPTDKHYRKLLAELTQGDISLEQEHDIIDEIDHLIQTSTDVFISAERREQLHEHIRNDVSGLSFLKVLLEDDSVRDIHIFNADDIQVEGKASNAQQKYPLPYRFDNDAQIIRAVNALVAPLDIRLDTQHPILNVQVDTLAIRAVTPPIAKNTTLHISKQNRIFNRSQIDGSALEFLRAAILAKLNILFVGGNRSGIQHLMNWLTHFMSGAVYTIASHHQLNAHSPHTTDLTTRSPKGQRVSTTTELLNVALNFQAEHIVIYDYDIEETGHLLRRMNDTQGTLLRYTGLSAINAIHTIEQDIHSQNGNLDVDMVRAFIESSVDLVVEQQQLKGGAQQLMQISVLCREKDKPIGLTPIFEFEQTEIYRGRVSGRFRPTGFRPEHLTIRFEEVGINLPPSIFGIGGRRYAKR